MYRSLLTGQFRLLRPHGDDQLRASLEVHDLKKCPSYIALSYKWGRAVNRKGRPLSATYSILLNDTEVMVQENLHDALLHLFPVVKRHDGYIFIDALSINQEDIVERSHQVRMMKAIYEGARVVFGWLGVPSNEERITQAIALMGRFNLTLREGLEKNDGDVDRFTTELSGDDPNLYPFPHTDTYEGWVGLMEIFDDWYWTRTWIQQEVTGPVKTYYFCGDQSFDRIYLAAACWFAYHCSLFPTIEQRFARAIGPSSAWRLNSMRGLDGSFGRGYETQLIHLLGTFRNTMCTDSRDKVFAPRNLATDVNDDDVSPDYSKSVREIYESVVRFYLTRYADLDFLGYVALPVENSKGMQRECKEAPLPSWIPDWRDRIKIQPLSLIGDTRKQIDRLFCAAGKHQHPDCQISGGELTVTGLIIDTVTALSSICEEPVDEAPEVRRWTPSDAGNRTYVPTSQSLDEAFRSTIIANVQYEPRRLGACVDWSLFDEPVNKLDPERFTFRHGFDVVINQVCFGRRLAFTEDGFLGIVPAACKEGDTVCTLWGGQTLYIIRAAAEKRYQLIGECYMHGMMHGEAFTTNSKSTAQAIHLT
ncbi:MAG: hypothetical protein M1822_007788 [Bathelium mastoideum]|nr:MAG: hypothetical protein M1822_007788 [Bathelium mastoideum]